MVEGLGISETKLSVLKTLHDGKSGLLQYLAITLIALSVLTFIVLVPTLSTIKRVQEEIRIKTDLSTKLTRKLNAMDALDAQYQNEKSFFDDLELIYPAGNNYSLLLSDIAQTVEDNNMTLTTVSFSSDNKTPATGVLTPNTVTIGIQGKKNNFLHLIKVFESYPQNMDIVGVSFANMRQRTDGTIVNDENSTFTIEMRFYSVGRADFYTFDEY